MSKKTIDINEAIVKNFIESLRPEDPEIREKIDLDYSYDGKTFLLFEIRPVWNNPQEKDQIEFAKIRYYKTREEWTLYWMRASGKWELYEPFPTSPYLDKIIEIIEEDSYACFFG